MKDLNKLPDNLPIPVNDGTCDHLPGMHLPDMILRGTSGIEVIPGKVAGTMVIFIYPMHGRPDSPPMVGWNDIPGARGCTPQACSYRDNFQKLEALGVTTYGLSAQALADQQEARLRLELPYDLLNDSQFEFTRALNLPTFEYRSTMYIKRITLISTGGVIRKVFYPVFPPDKNVDDVIDWLEQHRDSL